MIIDFADKKVFVYWRHDSRGDIVKGVCPGTTCVLADRPMKRMDIGYCIDNYKYVYAVCSTILHPKDKDKYNKAIGRELSLSKALRVTTFTKEERKVIWMSYLKQFKPRVHDRLSKVSEPAN